MNLPYWLNSWICCGVPAGVLLLLGFWLLDHVKELEIRVEDDRK